MTWTRLIINGIAYHRRGYLGVFFGILLASAILTGALIMGDSVDYTLNALALARLGGIHHAIHQPNRFFSHNLVAAMNAEQNVAAGGALQVQGMALAQRTDAAQSDQVNQVHIWGMDDNLARLADLNLAELQNNEVLINDKLATALHIGPGELLSLRLIRPGLMALDAPLSPRAEERLIRTAVTVKAIVSDDAAGRFSLRPSQIPPYNVFTNLSWLQEKVRLEGRINTLALGGACSLEQASSTLDACWKPEDVGLHMREAAPGILQLESDRIYLDDAATQAALSLPNARGTLAYLVNAISYNGRSTPYSFAVAGAESDALTETEADINAWLAEQLEVKAGDAITVAYSVVTPSNEFVEQFRTFTVRRILAMDDLTLEKDLMPGFPGLSDVESCQDWDIGMPMDEEALKDPENEAYWNTYRQTPKLMVSLRAGKEMWGNRFGQYTAVRFMHQEHDAAAMSALLRDRLSPAEAGLALQPVREQALAAAGEALDFGALFLGMSFFLILAALTLTGLLYRFSVQQRSHEIGILMTMGFRPIQVSALLLSEGGLIAGFGACGGALAGMLYAKSLLYGLALFWQGIASGAPIRYHAETSTLLVGAAIGLLCALSTIGWTSWRLSHRSLSRILAENQALAAPSLRASTRSAVVLLSAALLLLLIAGTASLLVLRSSLPNPAPAFFGIGGILLCAGLVGFLGLLRLMGRSKSRPLNTWYALARTEMARRPSRSVAVAAMLASGLFLVLSVAAMREDLFTHAGERWSGTGGFTLFAQTTAPLLEKPLLAELPSGTTVIGLRVREGDDASCLNLNRAATPRIYGVNSRVMAALGAFDASKSTDTVWSLLHESPPDQVVPALVGDADTALWGLKAHTDPEKGDVISYPDESGRDFSVRLVGTLPRRLSLFQGAILMDEEAFTRQFPAENGYRAFLIEAPSEALHQTMTLLKQKYERFGMDVVPAVERLSEFYVVESTYLLMFLVLGGFGVALGAIGMGIVLMRNLLERRQELAMLSVMGYPDRIIRRMLLVEHMLLLVFAVILGSLSALVAMLPAAMRTHTQIPWTLQFGIVNLVLGCGILSLVLLFRRIPEKNILESIRRE